MSKPSMEELLDKLVKSTVYSEPPSEHHHRIIKKVWDEVVSGRLSPGSAILDIGAGDGFLMSLATAAGHRPTGVNFTNEDVAACKAKDLVCLQGDMHDLPFFWEENFDLVWARHILEHSPFPMRALCEAHQVLKPGGLLYIEVPAPDTACFHQENGNHFSVLTQSAWTSLLRRAGFGIAQQSELTFSVVAGDDKYFLWLCQKPFAQEQTLTSAT